MYTLRARKNGHFPFYGINPVVRFLIVSDVVLVGAAGLLTPVFAIFILERISGGDAAVVGISAAIFLLAKSSVQIAGASVIDRIRGERDDFLMLLASTLVFSLLPLLYLIIDSAPELYAVQALNGVATGLSFPPYMAIMTRHIDKRREGTEWGIRFTLTDLIAAGAATVGGLIAVRFGFDLLIYLLVAAQLLGTALLLPLRRYMRRR